MPPKTPPQANKILNYFSRTPTSSSAKKKREQSPVGAEKEKETGVALQTVNDGNLTPKSSRISETPTSSKRAKSNDSSGLALFDIVMAKLDGYPSWPAVICEDPEKNTYFTNYKYHVQFFDDEQSHAWILKRDVKIFGSAEITTSLARLKDPKLKKAFKEAIAATEMDREERVKLLELREQDSSSDSIHIKADKSKDKDSDFEMESVSGDSDDNESEGVPESEPDTDLDSDEETPKRNKKNQNKRKLDFDSSPEVKKQTPAKRAKSSGKGSASIISTPSSQAEPKVGSTAVNHIDAADRQWPHLKLPFLQPEQIRDKYNKRMLIDGEINPEYDFTTLYIPEKHLLDQTPAMRQWWEFKRDNFDTILFFKLGKFYECFHMDAVVATKELQLLFMRGEHAHAGFPEKSFKRYADGMIQCGYKVARIEQTETPDMMEERCKKMHKPTKFDKVVKRELCRISSLGTRIMSDIDSDAFLPSSSYLFAISSQELKNSCFQFGVCFVDVSIGKFHITQFKDDQHCSTLRTMLVHYAPSEILYSGSDRQLGKLIDNIFPNVRKQPCKKFRSARDTLKLIVKGKYWESVSGEFKTQIVDSSDCLGQTCNDGFELAICSLGGIIEYLERAMIAEDILSLKSFELYSPPEKTTNQTVLGSNMILDSSAMNHMEILEDVKGGNKSLLKIIDKCVTPFGKRLFRGWVCLPICGRKEELIGRQEAVRELAESSSFLSKSKQICNQLQKLPDLERLLMQIHAQSSLKRSKEHPDSRAIMFEHVIYRKRKIGNFLTTLDGFETIVGILVDLQDWAKGLKSSLLRKLLCFESDGGDGKFPQCKPLINFFRNSFNAEDAKREGSIIPRQGADAEYDEALEAFDNANRALDQYLRDQSKFFGARCTYWGTGKNRFQLEIPESCARKAVDCQDEHYELKSSKKGFKRYHTETLVELISDLGKAEENKILALQDILRKLLEKFDKNYDKWSAAIQCISTFDALVSLSKTKMIFEVNGSVSCLPEIVWDGPRVFMAEELRNATLIDTRELIANDVKLENQTLLLSGPNMSGKTVLMRSVGLAAILAQIGAYVPAAVCQISPVDRIFTRIGAYDQALEAQSTFMVELNEASLIVNQSTEASLVLVDELGRGTSTFDGIAIAHAVLNELSQKIRCRTIFSTHFHSIVEDIQSLPYKVIVGHMAYMVQNVNKDNPTDEDVIFLYKLTDGVCSQSYGYNVAKMAGIPQTILRSSYKAGRAFEIQVESCRLLNAYIDSQKVGDKSSPMDEEKLDKLADYLSELLLTRNNSGIKNL